MTICAVCPSPISAERLQLQPRATCCSPGCSQVNRARRRQEGAARHRQRVREARAV